MRFIFLFISFNALAYTISGYEFTRYIRPQIKNITNDFYDLLKLEDKAHEINSELHTKNLQLANLYFPYFSDCRDNKSCYDWFIKISQFIIENYSDLKKETYLLALKVSDQNNDYFHALKSLNLLYGTLIKSCSNLFIHKVKENKTFNLFLAKDLATTVKDYLDNYHRLYFSLHETNNSHLYELVWVNFIQPLRVSYYRDNEENFVKYYPDLDRSWNEFHNLVSKNMRTKKTKRHNLLKMMHRRWNSILKTIIR